MKTFFIFSGMVLWALIITFVLYFLYVDIRYRIRMHNLNRKALQQSDEQEKEFMDKLKENSMIDKIPDSLKAKLKGKEKELEKAVLTLKEYAKKDLGEQEV